MAYRLIAVVVLLGALAIGAMRVEAQSVTVTAKGSGQISTVRCQPNFFTCSSGGRGTSFSFSFTGFNDEPAAPGSLSAIERETNTKIDWVTGTVFLNLDNHIAVGSGICTVTTADGQSSMADCRFTTQDRAEPGGGGDTFNLSINGPTIPLFMTQSTEIISGNIQIQ